MVADLSRREKGLSAFLVSSAINVIFFLAVYKLLYLHFETNDDPFMMNFVNGMFGFSDPHIPFSNYLYGLLLTFLYSLKPGIPWHSLCSYFVCLVSFTGTGFVFFRKSGTIKGLFLILLQLIFFGTICYIRMSFTKVSGLSSASGILLLLYSVSLNSTQKHEQRLSAVFGILLAAFGFCMRTEMFFSTVSLLSVLCIPFIPVLFNRQQLPTFLKKVISTSLCLLIVLLAFYSVNEFFWHQEGYRQWEDFCANRAAFLDYHPILLYEKAEELYSQNGITSSEIGLLSEYNLSDSDVFTVDFFKTILSIHQQKNTHTLSLKQLVQDFIVAMNSSVTHKTIFHGILAILFIWIIFEKKNLLSVSCILGWLILFSAEYCYLIFKGRYGYERVDFCMLFSGYCIVASCFSNENPRIEISASLFASLIASAFLLHTFLPNSYIRGSGYPEDKAIAEESLDKLKSLYHDEHIFIVPCADYNFSIYFPFYTPDEPFASRVIYITGWSAQHPLITSVLAEHGINNTMRDCIDRDDILWVDENINLTLDYIREHYCPSIHAEPFVLDNPYLASNVYHLLS